MNVNSHFCWLLSIIPSIKIPKQNRQEKIILKYFNKFEKLFTKRNSEVKEKKILKLFFSEFLGFCLLQNKIWDYNFSIIRGRILKKKMNFFWKNSHIQNISVRANIFEGCRIWESFWKIWTLNFCKACETWMQQNFLQKKNEEFFSCKDVF